MHCQKSDCQKSSISLHKTLLWPILQESYVPNIFDAAFQFKEYSVMRQPSAPRSGPRSGLDTLQRYVRALRFVSPLILGVFFLMIAILAVALHKQMPQNDLLFLLGILACAGLFVALMLRSVFRKMLVGVNNAITMLQTQKPRRMLVRFTGVMTLGGSVVKLWDPDSEELSSGLLLAAVRTTSKKQGSAKEAVPVDVYFSPAASSRDQELVFEVPQEHKTGKLRGLRGLSAGNVYWGKLCDRRQLDKAWKQMQLMMAALALFAICFVGAIAWSTHLGLENARQNFAKGKESLSWPIAPGRILDSSIEEVTIKRGKSRVPGYIARIRYEYSVDKKTYTASRIFYGYEAHTRRKYAEELVSYYRPGGTVSVRFEPHDPSQAVLEPGHMEWNKQEVENAERAMWISLAMSSLIFIMPVVMVVFMRRRRNALMSDLRQAMGLGGGQYGR